MTDDTTPIYYRVSPSLWRDRSWTDDMRLLASYLLTSPHRTLEGLFTLPKGYICGDLQWLPERLAEPFARLLADGFICYDEEAEVMLIVKALKYQRPENPNMDKAALRRLVTIAETDLDARFAGSAQRYAERFWKRLAERLPERFGKPQLYSTQLYSTQLRSGACARETPVENEQGSAQVEEQGRSIDRDPPHPDAPPADAEPEPAASDATEGDSDGTCDGASCTVREFDAGAVGPLRRVIAASEHPELWRQYGAGGQFDAQLAVYAKRLCHACRRDLGDYERPQRDDLCRAALVESVERLKGSRDVQAVIASRIKGPVTLLDLIGDRKLEELRRTKREPRRKGEPRHVSDVLPEFAGPMPEAVREEAS